MTDSTSDITRHPEAHHLAAAITLLVVMAYGGWQITQAARSLELGDIAQSWSDLLSGTTTKSLESKLEHGLPARENMIRTAYALRYILLNGSQEQVRIGSDDWLFLTEELTLYPQASAAMASRIQLIAQAAKALQRANVQLVVALVPDKSRIYKTQLPARYRSSQLAARYQDALQQLRSSGVASVDLATPLATAARSSQEVYYRSDTHWNQLGARIAAQTIAADIKNLHLDFPEYTYSTAAVGGAVNRNGDLIRLMGLEHTPALLHPKPDIETVQESTRMQADNSQFLFGDTQISVVLCGTSYSLRGNFHGYLQQSLSTEVLNTAKDGGGFLSSITAYLQDEAYLNSKPKVLIWEVPERFLQAPLHDEVEWLNHVGLNTNSH
jgi:alginate O-acetyltransferase complex protein AlgJ